MTFHVYGPSFEDRLFDPRGLFHGAPAAFLVGGSPSLLSQPHVLLESRGVLSFSVNSAGKLFRPTCLVASDEGRCVDARLLMDPTVLKFLLSTHARKPVRTSGPLSSVALAHVPGAVFVDPVPGMPDQDLLLPSAGLRWKRNSLFLGISVMYHLGIRRIVLAGCDFGTGYSHGAELSGDEEAWNSCLYRFEVSDLVSLKPVFDDAGLEIVDSSPESKVCPPNGPYRHVSLEDGVGMCLEGFPEDFDPPSSLPHVSRLHPGILRDVVARSVHLDVPEEEALGGDAPAVYNGQVGPKFQEPKSIVV